MGKGTAELRCQIGSDKCWSEEHGVSVSYWTAAEVARVVVERGIVESIS